MYAPSSSNTRVTRRIGSERPIADSQAFAIPFIEDYAAFWKSSICRIQLVSGFHLGKIWATIYKLLILRALDR